jgi:hypothetical protein
MARDVGSETIGSRGCATGIGALHGGLRSLRAIGEAAGQSDDAHRAELVAALEPRVRRLEPGVCFDVQYGLCLRGKRAGSLFRRGALCDELPEFVGGLGLEGLERVVLLGGTDYVATLQAHDPEVVARFRVVRFE